jgi:hypothetical protein
MLLSYLAIHRTCVGFFFFSVFTTVTKFLKGQLQGGRIYFVSGFQSTITGSIVLGETEHLGGEVGMWPGS